MNENYTEEMHFADAMVRGIKIGALLFAWLIFNLTSCEVVKVLKREQPLMDHREFNLKKWQQEYDQEMKKLSLSVDKLRIETQKNRPVIVKEE